MEPRFSCVTEGCNGSTMRPMKTFSRWIPVFALLLALPTKAHALTISGFLGKYFASNEGLTWSGEVTFNLIPMLDVGGFYEHSNGADDESRSFYGAVGRFTLPVFPFFADIRIGPHSIGFSNGATMSGTTTQLGLGYEFALAPGFNLVPRVGVNLADTNSTYPDWNGSVGLSLTML